MLDSLLKRSSAFLFPGQGSQTLGMAADLIDGFPEARAVFAAGSEILGCDLARICREGPEEELNSTRISQPAILLHSMAVLAILDKQAGAGEGENGWQGLCRRFPVLGTAGLSLGEYSALVFARSLSFEDAVFIVGKRGEFMQEACDAEKGSMTSVLGLGAEAVEEVVDRARSEGLRVNIANYNSPDQTVISGAEEAVAETAARLEAAGAKRVVALRVAGAYHSELMSEAGRRLEPLLRGIALREPEVPFFANISGRQVRDPEEIRGGLIRQVDHPVRWRETMAALVERGLEEALEPGPGKVIRGLLRNMSRDVKVAAAGTSEDLEKLLARAGR